MLPSMLRTPFVAGVVVMMLSVSLLPYGLALRCYECNSHNDSRCKEGKLPEAFHKDCSEHLEGNKYILCRKIVQHIDFEVNGNKPEERVIRNCGWDNSSYVNKCYQRSGFGGRQEVCSCTDDYCNSAPGGPQDIVSFTVVTGLTVFAISALQRVLFF